MEPIEYSEYLSELFETVLDGKVEELSDRDRRLLENSAKMVLQRLEK